jgi:hypothetical protein
MKINVMTVYIVTSQLVLLNTVISIGNINARRGICEKCVVLFKKLPGIGQRMDQGDNKTGKYLLAGQTFPKENRAGIFMNLVSF